MRPQIAFRKDKSLQDLPQSRTGSAEHLPNDCCKTDRDLAVIYTAWPHLPAPIRQAILALVEHSLGAPGIASIT
jgi:hypothetical protein